MNAWQHSEPFDFAPERKGRTGWICFKGGGSAPPPPDYAAQATAQGAANKETAIAQAVLGNPNVTNPYGQQTVTYTNDPTSGNLQSNVNQTLTPIGQQNFDQQQQINQKLGVAGSEGADYLQTLLRNPVYTGTAESMFSPTIANAGGIQNSVAGGGNIQNSFAGGGNIQNSVGGINTSGIAAMPVNAGTTGQQAIMQRLAPQIERENSQRNQELANQGITLGSDAYKNSRLLDDQRHNDLTSAAALQGLNLDMAANNQGFNQGLASANFGLSQGQFANAAQSQQFAQNQAQGQFANAAQGQQFQQNLNQGQFANQAQNQQYAQNQQNAQFGNSAAQQYLQDQVMLRNDPINTINAVRSGSQINMPQFQQYQGSSMQPAPILQGAQLQGQANQNAYNAQQGQANSFNSGLFSLGAAAVPLMFSDRRLKSNIRRIGTHKSGLPLYAYTMFGHPDIGVMAQDVLHVKPSAVRFTSAGWMGVNYASL